jgi:hypothetical protein
METVAKLPVLGPNSVDQQCIISRVVAIAIYNPTLIFAALHLLYPSCRVSRSLEGHRFRFFSGTDETVNRASGDLQSIYAMCLKDVLLKHRDC